MMHILLQKAFIYKKVRTPAPPSNFFYDKINGAWLCKEDKSLLVHSKDFPAISTKKLDLETGEDQKGQ